MLDKIADVAANAAQAGVETLVNEARQCRVVGCTERRAGRSRYCEQHGRRTGGSIVWGVLWLVDFLLFLSVAFVLFLAMWARC